MLTDCEKCGVNSEAKLDVEKDQVLCMGCGRVIDINPFMKRSMKQRNDIIDREQIMIPPNGLKYFCDNKDCAKPFSAEVDKKDRSVYCPHCGIKAKITAIAISLLEENKIFKGRTEAYFRDEDIHSDNKAIDQALSNSRPAIEMGKVTVTALDGDPGAKPKTTKPKASKKK